MNRLKINHLAVWLCFIILTGLGFLWYGPLFGAQWMELVGLDPAVVEANPPSIAIWITNIISTIAPLYMLAWLFTKIPVDSALQGGMIGFLIAFCFVFLTTMTSDLFAGNPYVLSWITGGFTLAGLTIAGMILGGWRKHHYIAM